MLPKARNGLTLLLRQLKLAPEILDAALSTLTVHSVQVTIPKFKLEAEMNLREMLERVWLFHDVFKCHHSYTTTHILVIVRL